ncbi:cytochrome d ubiquinol oxidase subunit II [Companilactobacillus sp. DQM5]|uniref:cytochrome d ubiquinol oxidase subunit II n=1 Tax=Companilactobacillus sp. DQM5 TaxID=3463359 RepID=UPI004059AA0C
MNSISHLQIVLFFLIVSEFSTFFVMNGTDFGIAISLPFITKNDDERNQLIDISAPVWGGNEAWYVTSIALILATFPIWYGALVSGYYLLFFLLWITFVFRGVAFDYRRKWKIKSYNRFWDNALFVSSIFPPVILGMILFSSHTQITIDSNFNILQSFSNLINITSIIGGLSIFTFSVKIGLERTIKNLDNTNIVSRANNILKYVNWLLYILLILSWYLLNIHYPIFNKAQLHFYILLIISFGALVYSHISNIKMNKRIAFWSTVISFSTFIINFFYSIYPNLILGQNKMNLTILKASSGLTSQTWTMWLIALMLPLMIIVQVFAYSLINRTLKIHKNIK